MNSVVPVNFIISSNGMQSYMIYLFDFLRKQKYVHLSVFTGRFVCHKQNHRFVPVSIR